MGIFTDQNARNYQSKLQTNLHLSPRRTSSNTPRRRPPIIRHSIVLRRLIRSRPMHQIDETNQKQTEEKQKFAGTNPTSAAAAARVRTATLPEGSQQAPRRRWTPRYHSQCSSPPRGPRTPIATSPKAERKLGNLRPAQARAKAPLQGQQEPSCTLGTPRRPERQPPRKPPRAPPP